MSATGELERIVKLDRLPQGVQVITATRAECAALAHRFGIPQVRALTARVTLEPEGREVAVSGRLDAEIEQHCAISGELFANRIEEPLAFRFVPGPARSAMPDEEIELESDALDEIEFEGEAFDLGEAIAQSLALAIDPYATGPEAERARRDAGIVGDDAPSGPFAALAQWKNSPPAPGN